LAWRTILRYLCITVERRFTFAPYRRPSLYRAQAMVTVGVMRIIAGAAIGAILGVRVRVKTVHLAVLIVAISERVMGDVCRLSARGLVTKERVMLIRAPRRQANGFLDLGGGKEVRHDRIDSIASA
jgi:hypothetical protein